MTLDEALNELGIDYDADAERARRAYLRLLKKRKPEVDRDGFMRLREAYELAKPYFEEVDLGRIVDAAMDAEAARPDGGRDVIRLETPAGVVFIHRAAPVGPDEPLSPDEPSLEKDEPFVEDTLATFEPPIESAEPADDAFAAEPVEPITKVPETEPAEPSIDELMAAGKFKKAARLMGNQYREAVQQGTMDADVPSPHEAVLLLLRLHEKNHFESARTLEKEFAEWLASTGSPVRLMAGTVGVMWLMARELSALSNKFPKELRESIATAVIEEKLDIAQRRAGWFQMTHVDRARDAALDLHAHAPTLAKLLSDALSQPEPRAAPERSRLSGIWGIGIAFIVLLNVFRMLLSSSTPTTTQSSYQGQSEPAEYYRPKPLPSRDSLKMDQETRDRMLKILPQIEMTIGSTAIESDLWLNRRLHDLRLAIDSGSCSVVYSEMNALGKDMRFLSDSLKASLYRDIQNLDSLFRTECIRQSAEKPLLDGGPQKKP